MSSPAAEETKLLTVQLEGPDGAQWTAIAGGTTVAETLEFAVASAPMGVRWRVVSWSELYGD